MEGHQTDDAGAPVIPRVSGKIAALERRADYLEGQLEGGRGSETGQNFAKAEVSAVRAGILALRYHRAEVEGMDTPILALQELVDALGKQALESESRPLPTQAVVAAFRRSEVVLEEWAG